MRQIIVSKQHNGLKTDKKKKYINKKSFEIKSAFLLRRHPFQEKKCTCRHHWTIVRIKNVYLEHVWMRKKYLS